MVGAPVAIAVVAGPQFGGSIDVLRLHAVALLPTAVIAFAGYGLMSLAEFRVILVCNIIGLLATAVLAAVLGSAYGAIGAAVGNLAGESTLAFLFVSALMRRRFQFQWRVPLLAGVAAVLTAVVGLVIPAAHVVQLLVATVLFGVLTLGLGLVPEELLAMLPLPGQIRRWRASSR
jgi:O-antigen/teichoic acid export membrane protein